MTFSIRFLSQWAPESELGNAAQYGEIQLGDYRETFAALIGFWSPHDYERQWQQAIRRLLEQKKESCLITSLHDPQAAEVLHWWLLYPDSDGVAVQNGLLLLRDLARPFETANPYSSIPPRETTNEDGYAISEWHVPREDFRKFLMSS